jgi:Domain of unknown function (DUF4385)
MKSAEPAPKPSEKPSFLGFDRASYPWKAGVNYRARPKLYRVGKGEQGVLICEPYKSELTRTGVSKRRSKRGAVRERSFHYSKAIWTMKTL